MLENMITFDENRILIPWVNWVINNVGKDALDLEYECMKCGKKIEALLVGSCPSCGHKDTRLIRFRGLPKIEW